jgi:hypothetical protein
MTWKNISQKIQIMKTYFVYFSPIVSCFILPKYKYFSQNFDRETKLYIHMKK